MQKTGANMTEDDVLDKLRHLPENMRIEVMDFMNFLIQKNIKINVQRDVNKAVLAVEDTWGSIRLSSETLKIIAEDMELEYEF